jgi:hypothetical protein
VRYRNRRGLERGNGPILLRIWRMHCKIRIARARDDACAARVRYA